MDIIKKSILAILFMLAVIGYTVWNFATGETTMTMFVVFMVILGIPLVNMINILIQELKKK